MEAETKLELVWKNDAGVEAKPTWVQLKAESKQISKVEDDADILDVTEIKDKSADNMCTFQISGVDIPDEFLNAGLHFESYCCVKFNTTNFGFTTMCNTNKPRCWQEIRTFMRQMRKVCLVDHLTKAGLPVDAGLAREK